VKWHTLESREVCKRFVKEQRRSFYFLQVAGLLKIREREGEREISNERFEVVRNVFKKHCSLVHYGEVLK
jgi:hypothetical protein